MKLCNELLCTGCGACVNICPNSCISMVQNTQGFDYPKINEDKCVKCGLCEKVCAKVMDGLEERNPQAYSMMLKDDEVLKRSSSGGAAYALSKYVLENGGLVFGAAYTEDFHVHHIGISNIEDLKKLQGSKYVQSSTELCFKEAKEALLAGKQVLYCGTPCQIHGLYACLDGTDVSNLITCDLLCAGVPSPGVFEKYIGELKCKYGRIDHYNFRSKKYGYGYGYLIQSIIDGREKILTSNDASFVKTMSRGFVRESCFNCKFRNINRAGDITIGDFWDLSVPFEQWTKGISVVIVNTAKGQKLVNSVINEAVVNEISIDSCIKSRSASFKGSRKKPENYNNFFLDYPKITWFELSKKYLIPKSVKGRIAELFPPFVLAFVRNIRRKFHS